MTDMTGIDHGGGIRSGLDAGQTEARNIAAVSKPRQIVLLLLGRTKLQEQFTGAERVRHHHRYCQRDAATRQLANDLSMGIGGEAKTAELLRDDHPEEAPILQKCPN